MSYLLDAPLPPVTVGVFDRGQPQPVSITDFIGTAPAVIVGVPKAFTPVCSTTHLPGIIAKFDKLREAGIDMICVLAPDNVWVMQSWKQTLAAPDGMSFVSDGNSEFIDHFGLKASCPELFLGTCSRRYVLQVNNGRIKRASVEESIYDVVCTAADRQLELARQDLAPKRPMRWTRN